MACFAGIVRLFRLIKRGRRRLGYGACARGDGIQLKLVGASIAMATASAKRLDKHRREQSRARRIEAPATKVAQAVELDDNALVK